jgi:hypothetical protein
MTKTIVLTDLVIKYLNVEYLTQRVVVGYQMADASGEVYQAGEAIFWVTIPESMKDINGNPIPNPENWFLLPASYLPTLVSLRDDADSALTAKYLV